MQPVADRVLMILHLAHVQVQPNGEQLQVIANYFKEAEIRLVVERIFKLAEVRCVSCPLWMSRRTGLHTLHALLEWASAL